MNGDLPLAQTPVVILAGGLGTRLQSVVADRPKGLAAIGERSFLEIQIGLLCDQGARHFILCIGHRAEQIRDLFKDGTSFGVRIDYSVEREQLLGTAGALKLAERFFAPRALVVNGDTYLDTDYNAIVGAHLDRVKLDGARATLTLCRLADASRFGTVNVDQSGRYVTGFREKDPQRQPTPGWLNAGAYVIERPLLDLIPDGVAYSLERDWLPQAIAAGIPLAANGRDEPFYDIGTPDDYRRFAAWYEETSGGQVISQERVPDRSKRKAAVFLDRDGVIIEDAHYLSRLDQIRLIPGAAAAIRSLNVAGIPVIVVTNQAGVARGLFPESFIAEAHGFLAERLAEEGARIDAWYACPHHAEHGNPPFRIACDCRKPKPGMLLRAAREHRLDLTTSWLIGDKLSDCAAGAAAGCRTILVRTGHGASEELPFDYTGFNLEAVAPALPEAIQLYFARCAFSVRRAAA